MKMYEQMEEALCVDEQRDRWDTITAVYRQVMMFTRDLH